MKTDEINQTQDEMLARYLSDEMTEMESLAFENANAVSGPEKARIENMKKKWISIKEYGEATSPDTRKPWEKLHSRLADEKLLPLYKFPQKSRVMLNLFKVAALFLVLAGAGIMIYLNMNRNPAIEMVQLNTGSETNTLIKTLDDGSVVYIAQNSLFSFPKTFEEKSRNVTLKGEAFFDITPNPRKPFIIETDEAIIQVLGTAFNVKTANGDGFELFVDRGKVKVSLKKDPTQTQFVVAGEKIATMKNSLIKSKSAINQANSWFKQRMHFKDEQLQNIINVLNRNFNTTFVVAEKEIGNRRLTVTFQMETVETMTELICVTLNLKSQNINGSVVLSENNENKPQN
jgi:ferric-dicitrate binding protein FerR (iron transport regulator)